MIYVWGFVCVNVFVSIFFVSFLNAPEFCLKVADLAALPDFHRLIHAAGDHVRMRFVEINGCTKVFVSFQGLHAPLVGEIPHTQGFIVAS